MSSMAMSGHFPQTLKLSGSVGHLSGSNEPFQPQIPQRCGGPYIHNKQPPTMTDSAQ